jgi:hypothetical protein
MCPPIRVVGHYRYDTATELELLNQLYSRLRLYTNFFQPVMKLVKKTRIGSMGQKHMLRRIRSAPPPLFYYPDWPRIVYALSHTRLVCLAR